ncbi:hypothetical protein CCHR01_15933 [Colletotrichum chrysophilum]|uniref:Uncharacterized protein n=1 Tax=Colletotrichum chrysophilum TaxID=1836956 RepID=A0AAD9A4S6_9PEZI|nr:hypothetical protein CCHR01_15933 [Colletotrichum chrysophilum]
MPLFSGYLTASHESPPTKMTTVKWYHTWAITSQPSAANQRLGARMQSYKRLDRETLQPTQTHKLTCHIRPGQELEAGHRGCRRRAPGCADAVRLTLHHPNTIREATFRLSLPALRRHQGAPPPITPLWWRAVLFTVSCACTHTHTHTHRKHPPYIPSPFISDGN